MTATPAVEAPGSALSAPQAPPTSNDAPLHAPLTVLYDGTCGFCTRQARLAQRLARPGRVAIRSTAEPGVLEQYLGITPEAANRQLYVHEERTGRRYGGAAAVARLMRETPVIGPIGWLYYVPGVRQVADALYRLFARNRHRISRLLGWQPLPNDSCADGACTLPPRPSTERTAAPS